MELMQLSMIGGFMASTQPAGAGSSTGGSADAGSAAGAALLLQGLPTAELGAAEAAALEAVLEGEEGHEEEEKDEEVEGLGEVGSECGYGYSEDLEGVRGQGRVSLRGGPAQEGPSTPKKAQGGVGLLQQLGRSLSGRRGQEAGALGSHTAPFGRSWNGRRDNGQGRAEPESPSSAPAPTHTLQQLGKSRSARET